MPQRWTDVARWWFPDLALVLATVTLFYCLFLFGGPEKLFRDSDAGWHIRTGQLILAERRLPDVDPYSFSRAGQTWFAWEWGSDVLIGTVFAMAGLRGVVLLFAGVIALTIWLWTRLHWAAGSSFLFAALLAPLVLTTSSLHWLARPHVFSWPFLIGIFLLAERPPERWSKMHGVIFAASGCVWANMHASFFLAPLIMLLYAAGDFACHRISPSPDQQRRPSTRYWLAASAFFVAGTFLNPYGVDLHLHLLRYLTDWELLDRVAEFQSFNFHADGAGQILVTLGVAAAGTALALPARQWGRFLAGCLFLAIALRSARGLPIAALVLLPLAGGTFTSLLESAKGLAPVAARHLRLALQYSANLRSLELNHRGWAWVPVVLVGVALLSGLPSVQARTGFSPEEFPVAASETLASLPSSARILSTDKFGGFLIYRFAGQRKVFFDGRSDFYGSDFMKAYLSLVELRPGWRNTLARYAFTHAVLPESSPLAAALIESGWKPMYRDKLACLLAAPTN